MKVAIIVAIAEGNAIGKDQQLLCHMPADLKRFKALTTGHTIIMGRKTFESLPHALPNRRNIVLSSQPKVNFPGCEVCTSLPEALACCAGEEEVFILGGGQVYQQALSLTDSCISPISTTLSPKRLHSSQSWMLHNGKKPSGRSIRPMRRTPIPIPTLINVGKGILNDSFTLF